MDFTLLLTLLPIIAVSISAVSAWFAMFAFFDNRRRAHHEARRSVLLDRFSECVLLVTDGLEHLDYGLRLSGNLAANQPVDAKDPQLEQFIQKIAQAFDDAQSQFEGRCTVTQILLKGEVTVATARHIEHLRTITSDYHHTVALMFTYRQSLSRIQRHAMKKEADSLAMKIKSMLTSTLTITKREIYNPAVASIHKGPTRRRVV